MAKQVLAIGDSGNDLVNKFNNNADELYDGQNIQDLPSGTKVDGSEQVPVFQAGNAVVLSPEQLAGDPAIESMGASRDKVKLFTRFLGPIRGSTLQTSGASSPLQIPGEVGFGLIGDTGATTSRYSAFTGLMNGIGGLLLQSSGGWVGVMTEMDDVEWDTNREIDFRVALGFVASQLPDAVGETYEVYVGAFDPADLDGTAPTKGVFFRAGPANANWQYFVGDGVTSTGYLDTGVAHGASEFAPEVLRVRHNGTDNQTEFYIGTGNAKGTVLDSTQAWFEGASQVFGDHRMAFGVFWRSVTGTAEKSVVLGAARLEIEHNININGGNDLI